MLICRHLPALGESLATLVAAMPVAFLEPDLNAHNPLSVFNTKTPRERASEYPPHYPINEPYIDIAVYIILSLFKCLFQSSVCPTQWRRCVQRCRVLRNCWKMSTMSQSLVLATVTCHRSEGLMGCLSVYKQLHFWSVWSYNNIVTSCMKMH